MKAQNFVVAIFFLTSLTLANAETLERSSSTDRVEVEHIDGMEIDRTEEMGEHPEIGEHPEMVEVDHDHGTEDSSHH